MIPSKLAFVVILTIAASHRPACAGESESALGQLELAAGRPVSASTPGMTARTADSSELESFMRQPAVQGFVGALKKGECPSYEINHDQGGALLVALLWASRNHAEPGSAFSRLAAAVKESSGLELRPMTMEEADAWGGHGLARTLLGLYRGKDMVLLIDAVYMGRDSLFSCYAPAAKSIIPEPPSVPSDQSAPSTRDSEPSEEKDRAPSGWRGKDEEG